MYASHDHVDNIRQMIAQSAVVFNFINSFFGYGEFFVILI